MIGIVGLVLLATSLVAFFKTYKQRERSLWRLAEKVVVLFALAFGYGFDHFGFRRNE
jgi:uncharacterized membrane protein YsdA (DUF1294 family)